MSLPQAPAPPSLPPACADCKTLTQSAAGGLSSQSLSSILRSASGKMRIDAGAVSIITDPKALHTIVLDHVAKEARLLPVQPPGASLPKLPGVAIPGLAAPGAAAPVMAAVSLGKALIQGHEVEGMRYTLPLPATAQLPKVPQVPGMPQAPKPPALPVPTTAEVWTSVKLGLPVLTKVTGAFGQLTCACKTAPAAEPHPTAFQIPPEYKTIPPAPALPKP